MYVLPALTHYITTMLIAADLEVLFIHRVDSTEIDIILDNVIEKLVKVSVEHLQVFCSLSLYVNTCSQCLSKFQRSVERSS